MTVLVREEIELAKAEMTQKVSSIARGAAAIVAGAVFGVFAVIFLLLTLAWGLDAILINGAGDIWIGFGIVLVVLVVATIGAFLFAWRKLKVGAPTPQMALDEAKKIRATVSTGAEAER
jgi:Putative Actinobacterial Holin-X, holin superfamily III